MATKNTTKVTRSLALATINDFIRANMPTFIEFAGDPAYKDIIGVIEKMHAQIEASAMRKANTPTKSQIVNRNLAARVLDAMPENMWVSSKWIANNVAEVMTTQKAIALTRLLIEDGSVTRSVTDAGRPVFAKVGMNDAPTNDNTLMC